MSGDNDVEYGGVNGSGANQPSLLSDLDSLTEPSLESLPGGAVAAGPHNVTSSKTPGNNRYLPSIEGAAAASAGAAQQQALAGNHFGSIEDELLLLRMLNIQQQQERTADRR